MTPSPSLTSDQISKNRPVLLWRPDSDETGVHPGVDQVAELLGVSADAIIAAIHSGDLLEGWFVDWEVAEKG
jgi:hypothetical protein